MPPAFLGSEIMPKGYIRDKTDMKFLILFILDVIEEPVDSDVLLEAVLSDECADFFTFSEACGELLEDGFIEQNFKKYEITVSGRLNFRALGQVLPYSVRREAQDAAIRAISVARRNANIKTSTHKAEGKNHYITTLAMSDGNDDIVKIDVLTVTAEQGIAIEKNFQGNAEAIFRRVLSALLDKYDGEKKKNE